MPDLNQLLLILHFLGLALGFSATVTGMVMGGLLAAATPPERGVLGRVMPVMSHVGGGGLLLLWATGLILVFTKWGGFGSLPWQFHAKLTAVVLLTGAVGMSHAVQAKVKRGDAAAAQRLPAIGTATLIFSVLAVVFAVLTFD